MAALSLSAQVLVPKASSDFTYKYEADVLPVAAGLGFTLTNTYSGFSEANFASVSDGILSLDTTSAGATGGLFYYAVPQGVSTNWNVSATSPFTLELRINMVNTGFTGGLQGGVLFRDGTNNGLFGWRLATDPANYQYVVGGNSATTVPVDAGFQIIRIASYVEGGLRYYNLYINQQLIGSYNVTTTGGGQLSFGDLISSSSAFHSDLQLDYLRWDTSGAYAPIPEPANLALCGGLCLMIFVSFRKFKKCIS